MEATKETLHQLKNLIKDRRVVFSHLSWQRFLLVLFLIIGLVFFISGTIFIFISIVQSMYVEELTNQIADETNLERYKDVIRHICTEVIQPKEMWSACKSLFLGISFLALSRYCQKVLNRNKYILTLEEEIKKLHV
jgi:hypothetical protein